MRKLFFFVLPKGFLLLFSLFGFLFGIHGQDIEPRRWASLPLGIHVVGLGYINTTGSLAFDPLLQVQDASVAVNSYVALYVYPFRIGNKLARIDFLLPFSKAQWDGLLEGQPTVINRSGFADSRLRFSLNFFGPNAMKADELQEYHRAHPVFTTVGISVALTLPTGQYFEEKLLNLGSNSLVFRPQIGMLHSWQKWSYELTASVFLYSNNNNFSSGNRKKLEPIFALQTHLIKRFKQRYWASLSIGSGLGGQSIVNNQTNNDNRKNLLAAISFGFMMNKRQMIKMVYERSESLSTVGADTNSFGLVWNNVF